MAQQSQSVDQEDGQSTRSVHDMASRNKKVVRVSIIGIVANLILAAGKAVVGVLTGSIAFVLDAVNSLTDAFSSIVTIIGTRLAAMRPSRKHPYGYGRIESLTSVIIAALILAAGVVSMRESVVKIIHPTEPDYTIVAIAVMTAAALVKVFLGIYFKRAGRAINSHPLIASGVDASYDALLTGGTVVAAIVCLLTHIDIDGWVGAVISLFIIKAGWDILVEAVGSIIGDRPSYEMTQSLEKLADGFPQVRGVFDVIIDSFGPDFYLASMHIEVPDGMSAKEIHHITRAMAEKAWYEHHCLLTVGIYAQNDTGEFAPLYEAVHKVVADHDEILQTHGFYVDAEKSTVYFDVVVDFHHDAEAVRDDVVRALRTLYPEYRYDVALDTDYSS